MNFSRFFVIFLTQVFSSFFRHFFCFCSSRFAFTSFFHFLLCLIFDFLHLPSSWTQFFWTAISPSFCKKTLQLFLYFMHALPLYDHLLKDLFICCLFFSLRFFTVSITFVSLFLLLFSLSITSLKEKFVELLQSKKKLVCLIPFLLVTFFIFICLYMFFPQFPFFVLFSCVFEHFSFWVLVLECLFLCRSLFYVSLFLKTLCGLIILFLSFFLSLLSHTLLVHKNV